MIALSETDLLVLERGFVSGLGNTIRIFHVPLRVTPEVSGVTSLAALGADEHSAALAAKTLLVDVANCPSSGATNPPGDPANPLLENFEAMTLGQPRRQPDHARRGAGRTGVDARGPGRPGRPVAVDGGPAGQKMGCLRAAHLCCYHTSAWPSPRRSAPAE
jgi:hypothetical protein